VTNSRFAAAAAMAEQDEARRMAEREERGGFGGPPSRGGGDYQSRSGGGGGGLSSSFSRNSGPPPVANSRFAAAVAADADYMNKDDRDRRDREIAAERERDREGGYRDGGRGGYGGRSGGGGGGFRMDDLPRGPRASQLDDLPKGPRASMEDHHPVVAAGTQRVDALLSLPKQKSKQSAPLEPIAKEHEGNMLELPKAVALNTKDKEEELVLGVPQKERPPAPEPVVVTPAPPAENAAELMAEFVSGNKLGDDLKAWTEEHRNSLPMLDKIIFELLDKVEKLNPNPECLWAGPDKYGAALLALTEDDIVNQMHVLWGIQFYCDKMGFPKIDEEYLVQSMFRAMYKYDLVEEDAFMEWKEDETEVFEKGKLKAVIQTTEWFAWLEEEDEEEEEEEELEE
jgi:hypothetical protein